MRLGISTFHPTEMKKGRREGYLNFFLLLFLIEALLGKGYINMDGFGYHKV